MRSMFIGGRLNELLWKVKEEEGEGETFFRLRRTVGEIMGVMLEEVMNPIYSLYPDVRPLELSAPE